MVRVRDDGGDLTPYYDELDRQKAEKLHQKALARERRGKLSHALEKGFVWVSITLTLPLWLPLAGIWWILGRPSLGYTLQRHYGDDTIISAIVVGAVLWIVGAIVSTVIFVHSTESYCEQHSMEIACIQMDIDKQQADLNKLRSKQDK